MIHPAAASNFNSDRDIAATSIAYDVEGQPASWNWGLGIAATLVHTVTRDPLGRITKIKDAKSGTTYSEVDYTYDDDGDIIDSIDRGRQYRSIQQQPTTVADVTWTHATDSMRDMLTTWYDADNVQHALTLNSANGHRITETVAGVAGYDYFYFQSATELAQWRDKAGGNFTSDIQWIPTASFAAVLVDKKKDGIYETSSMTYGQRGELSQYTTSLGVATVKKDQNMRRWSLKIPTDIREVNYRYAPTGELLDRHSLWYDSGFGEETGNRDEYIHLAGMAIAATHTDNNHPSPVTWWLGHDRQGVPRRVIQAGSSHKQLSRLVMGAWGDGVQVWDESEVPGAGLVKLPFRHAGQLADTESEGAIVDNQWRMYQPDLGTYLSPDPEHRASATSYAGPQAYAYALGRPLTAMDPFGRRPRFAPGTHFGNELDTAFAAANTAMTAIIASGNNYGEERCCFIVRDECATQRLEHFWFTPIESGTTNPFTGRRSCNPSKPANGELIGHLHTHPSLRPRSLMPPR